MEKYFKWMNKGEKGKGAHEPKAQKARAYPSFISTKHLGVLLLPPGRHTSPSQGYPPAVCCRYPFIAGFQLTPQRPCWWTKTKVFPPLGKNSFFPQILLKNFYSFVYQHGHLVTWLKTSSTPGWRKTKWSKVPCLRKQHNGWGLNPGPPDPQFEVLTSRPHTPLQWMNPEGYSIYPWVGMCGPAPHTLTLCKTKITV